MPKHNLDLSGEANDAGNSAKSQRREPSENSIRPTKIRVKDTQMPPAREPPTGARQPGAAPNGTRGNDQTATPAAPSPGRARADGRRKAEIASSAADAARAVPDEVAKRFIRDGRHYYFPD